MGGPNKVLRFFGTRRNCAECAMNHRCMWRDIESRMLEGVAVVPELFRKGEALFHAGEPMRALYMVRSGAVKSCLVSQDGSEQVIGFHGLGELVGLEGFADGRYASSVVALDTTSVCAVGLDDLRLWGQRTREIHALSMQMMACAIRERNGLLGLIGGAKSAEQRLASFLLQVAEKQRACGYSATVVALPMSRRDIASHLGLTVETICRLFTRMRACGMIEARRNEVTLLDPEALATLAGEEFVVEEDARAADRRAAEQ